jgi:molybdenum cofactor biosynthesis enzyme
MHYLGDRFWKSSRNVKSVSGKKAHTNTSSASNCVRLKVVKTAQNMDCSQRGAATEVAHLDAYKNRNELWNVIFLCRNCHAQQKPQAKCSVKKKSNIKNEYRVSYPPRRSIDVRITASTITQCFWG